jgi:hypothetical protein
VYVACGPRLAVIRGWRALSARVVSIAASIASCPADEKKVGARSALIPDSIAAAAIWSAWK